MFISIISVQGRPLILVAQVRYTFFLIFVAGNLLVNAIHETKEK